LPGVQRANSVFVNCPFDPGYKSMLEAVVFAVSACGYTVRSALEVEDSGDLRLTKIIGLIEQSRLSVHDISRVTLDVATKLPRFNMPIELGIALGMKHLGRKALRQHKMLVLDSDRYRYRVSASDLAGIDISEHSDDPEKIIAAVRAFLASDSDKLLPTEDVIYTLYVAFETELPAMAAAARQTVAKLSYKDRLRHLNAFLAGGS